MSRRTKIAVWTSFAAIVVVAVIILALSFRREPSEQGLPEALDGAIVAASDNLHLQAPIANGLVTATAAGYTTSAKSNISGFFRLPLAPEWRRGEQITFTVRVPNYQPLQQTFSPGADLFVVRLVPLAQSSDAPPPTGPQTTISNVRTRFSTEFQITSNINSIAPTFDVANRGNQPCDANGPCSPDGRWKASVATKTIDAGPDNQFVNTRVSCIAGPCPFTRIQDNSWTQPTRVLNIRILNWSDPTTFLIEAEVSRTQRSNFVREAYPAIFGDAMTFTLPPGAQGLSIEADINGHRIIFPIGPALNLSWATCNTEKESDSSTLFRCELKSGYRFQQQPPGTS